MEKVAHGIHKDKFWLAPLEGKVDKVVMECKRESIYVTPVAHGFKAMRKSFCITVCTAIADFCTAGRWIPGSFRPFYFGIKGHFFLSFNRATEVDTSTSHV